MFLTPAALQGMFTGYSMAFNKGFEGPETLWSRIAMKTQSTGSDETYGWLKTMPGMREWIGPRVINNVAASSYTITNRSFEETVGVPRDDVEDDTYGLHTPLFTELGRVAAEQPDRLVFDLLNAGFNTGCYDDQFFFDVDHPVEDELGVRQSVSNVQAGSGEAWYLLDTSRAVRPLVYQERRSFGTLIRKDQPEDDNVFFNKELIYGCDGRGNAGFGLWQLAFGSKATLSAANYAAARSAMMKMTGDRGRKLGIRPTVLVVGPDNESAGRKLLNSEYASGGESNEWKGTAELIVTPWVH